MANIKLFDVSGNIKEYVSSNVTLEKELQTIIENNMETFFGVTFLASEFRTSDGGRMDSIGIDENHCPVILEYKRSLNENVINQGLFYLNWLLDHKDSFKVLVISKLGMDIADAVDWTMPRVLCIAGDFTKYDESAIKQMNRNISLIRYRKFGDGLLMFEQLNENTVSVLSDEPDGNTVKTKSSSKTFAEHIKSANPEILELYESIRDYILRQGDDISENQLKLYVAFRKIRNFICAEVFNNRIFLRLRLDVESVTYEEGFIRDTSRIGHFGTGDVEILIKNRSDFEKAKPLIDRAYNEN